MKKKILSIGDIHGRDTWKEILFGSSYEYNIWATAVANGASPVDELWKDMPFMSYDKIIFVGDYVDSYKISNSVIKHNLHEIIELKKALGDLVVLLIGNHDVQYIVDDQVCSGYRPEMHIDLKQMFTENADLFKFAHSETDKNGQIWLWSHAGVTTGWYDLFKKTIEHDSYRHRHLFGDIKNDSIADMLNMAWKVREETLFYVDAYSGGSAKWAGPVWVRPAVFTQHSLDNVFQVVGHTPVKSFSEHKEKNHSLFFIDCVEYGDGKGFEADLYPLDDN